jgi:glycosyltransferase involved in cell wall biosynthesis
MSRPRLFFILDSLEEDEVGEQVEILLGRLSRARFEPRVVSLGPRGSLGSRLREMKVTVHRLDLSGAMGALVAVPRLRKLLAGLGADLLQTFQPWSGTVAQLAAPRGVEVFRWVQGMAPRPANMEERLKAWLERRASLHRKRHFIASDVGAVQRVRRQYGVEHVEVVPQCVDVSLLQDRMKSLSQDAARIRLGMEAGQRAIVALSDFRDRGQMAQLLEGFATARREEAALRLFVVGRGPEEGAARGYAEDLRLEDAVLFMGTIADRPALLRVTGAVVDARSWPGWSRTSVEAMGLGIPVVRWVDADDAPENERYPAHTTGPADRFARDILDVLNDGALRARMAAQGTEEARVYDASKVADAWARIYGV